MRPSLLTWNSVNINDGTIFKSSIPPGQMANLSANAVTVNRAGDFPFLSTTVLNPHTFTIEIYVAAAYNINTARELMKKTFNIMDTRRHNLVIADKNDSDKQYYLTGYPVRVVSQGDDQPNAFFVTFQVEYPYWRLVTPTADSWDITASADSFEVTNGGNINVKPVFTITPTTTKNGGYKYRRYVPVYNNMDRTFSAPLDVTNGGLDVQSLINAGKMQADGDDFRVWMDGQFADRWLYGVDSDSDPGKAWINFDMQPRHEGTTSATFDSDDTTISLAQTRKNLALLRTLKVLSNKTFLIDSEAVVYADSDIDTINYQITNLSRGQKDTTAASHVSGSTIRHIEHDLWLLYGDSDVTAPDADSDLEPIFDLSSTNAAWKYTNYYDRRSPTRPGAWTPEVLSSKTGLSYYYTGANNTFADPSTCLGLAMIGAGDFQIPNEEGTLDWLFTHSCGITQVVYSGEVYNTGSWPAVVGLQYRQPNTVWYTAVDESEPAVATSWEAFGPHTVSLGGTYEAIRHVIDGRLDSVVNEKAMAQFDTHTLTFDSDNLPTISVNAEAFINFFDFTLTNATTGEYIRVTTPCPVNTALTIDCENKRAYLADGTRVNVVLSSDREAWLDLEPGANTLQWSDTGTVEVTVVVSHRDRVL